MKKAVRGDEILEEGEIEPQMDTDEHGLKER